jgi:hypothetical protein
MFADTEARSAAGEFALVDASGAHCAVTGWRRVSVFGGLSALPYLLTRSVFARPSLRIIAQLDVDAMRALVASQLALRYRTAHESGVGGAQSFRELLASAGSPAELLRVVARERLA